MQRLQSLLKLRSLRNLPLPSYPFEIAMVNFEKFVQPISNFFRGVYEEGRDWVFKYFLPKPLLVLLAGYAGVLMLGKSMGLLEGASAGDPSRWTGNRVVLTGLITSQPDPRPRGTVYILRAETLRITGDPHSTHSVNGLVFIQIGGAPSGFGSPNDRLEIFGKITQPKSTKIPGVFDYDEYLHNHGIHSQIYTSARSVRNLGPSREYSLRRAGWRIHQIIVEIFSRYLDPEKEAVLSGLAVGDRPRFHPEIKRIFVESGTMHILVASGSNVAFVIGVWYLLARFLLRFPRKMAVLSSLPGVWAYVLIVGGDPPILRAGVMATAGITGYLLAREDKAFHSLTLAALAMIILNPRTLFDVGFQMSFATVFGLLYYLPKIQPWIWRSPSYLRWLYLLAGSTITAQIWLWPITAVVFKKFYPVSLIANIFVIPLAAGGLTAGLLLLISHSIHFHLIYMPHILSGFQSLTSLYLQFLINLVRFFADHPGKIIWLKSPSYLWCCVFYLGCLSVSHLRLRKAARLGFSLSLSFIFFSFISGLKSPVPQGALSVIWLSAGREISTVIQSGKTTILINPPAKDTDGALEKIFLPFLSEKNISELDAVLFSHPPSNIPELKKLFSKKLPAKKFISLAEPEAKFKIPPFTFQSLPGATRSAPEIPLLIRYEKTNILLSHYLPTKTQKFILQSGLKRIDILQSRFSDRQRWEVEFLQRYKPRLLVETGFDSPRQPSCPPWEGLETIVVQKRGWFELLKEPDQEKGRNFAARFFFLKKWMARKPDKKPPA